MRPVNKGYSPKNYSFYSDAKNDLIDRIGSYCSYCERSMARSSLEVEHIIPKTKFPQYELDWNNFLLVCKNCNATKAQNVSPETKSSYLWPHIDNTFKYIEYLGDGIIQVKDDTPDVIKMKANKLIELVGLDRSGEHPLLSDKDDRWEKRKEIWETAQIQKESYAKSPNKQFAIKCILDIVKNNTCPGSWSIFMTVFKNEKEVLEQLIINFPVDESAFNENFIAIDRI